MIAPRFTDQPFPLRRPVSRPAGLPAPEDGFSSRPSSGAGYSLVTLPLADPVLVLLRLICAHEAVEDDAQMISRLVAAHAERIGIAALAAVPQGGEAASRVAHNHETAGSSPAPATRILPNQSAGGGGNPAAPAGGCGPP